MSIATSKSFIKANSQSEIATAKKLDRLDSLKGSVCEPLLEDTFGPLSNVRWALGAISENSFEPDVSEIQQMLYLTCYGRFGVYIPSIANFGIRIELKYWDCVPTRRSGRIVLRLRIFATTIFRLVFIFFLFLSSCLPYTLAVCYIVSVVDSSYSTASSLFLLRF